MMDVIKLLTSWPQAAPTTDSELARLMSSPQVMRLALDKEIQLAYNGGIAKAMVLHTWRKLDLVPDGAGSKRRRLDD